MTLERQEIISAIKRHLDKGIGFDSGDWQIFRAYQTTLNVVIPNIAAELGISTLELTGERIETFLQDNQNPVALEQCRMLGVSTTGLTLGDAISIAKQAYYQWSETAVRLEQQRRTGLRGRNI